MIDSKQAGCIQCLTRRSGLLQVLDGEMLERADREKRLQVYKRRQVIFHQGSAPSHVFCIHSGQVKLYKMGSKSEEQVIRVLGPGDAFGYRPLLAGETYASTAVALERTEVCAIPERTFFDLLELSPRLARVVMERLAREVRIFEDQVIGLSQRSVLQRTAHLILMMLKGCGEKTDHGVRLSAPMKRMEMAQMIGTTPETFSRTLHSLANEEILSLSRSEILVRDIEGLKRLAE
ncbi:MAG: Crp/Fnr family transcriptional regulator [Candidatus Eisenbacteria bacterium]|nr:Crp/Fnr family transcriptional regulator [Candidatus Eisenbacteria bacterium]